MTSRAEVDLRSYKTSLEKALAGESGDDISNQETISSILTFLEEFPMTIDLLRSTLIGHVLNNIKKKYSSEAVGTRAKVLITKWKETVSSTAAPSTSTATAPTKDPISSKSSRKGKDDRVVAEVDDNKATELGFDFVAMTKKLPEGRLKV